MTTTPPDKATETTKIATSATALKDADASTGVTSPTEGNEAIAENSSLQFLYDAMDKLNPEKNDLNLVPKEITSSTLTTRLRGVCRINRLIDCASDLRHSFIECGVREVYQKCIDELCGWILDKKIIEHIFGPNCHVEIIKQSHNILAFIAQALDDEHVNVIWSASLLKHCGRQVLDLLTTLVRHMRTGPVLHLYWLVQNLSTEEHTEHTLSLTSCILRYIWMHSPCINQVHFLQKSQEAQPDLASNEDQENSPQELSEPTTNRDAVESKIYSLFTERKFSRQYHQEHIRNMCATLPSAAEECRKLSHYMNPHDNTFDTSRNANTANTTSTNTTSTNDFSLTYGKSKSEEDDIEWYNECLNQSRLGNGNSFDDQSTERSVSSRSNSDHDEKCLEQSLEDAIKGLDRAMKPRKQRTLTSPVSETLASGAGGDIRGLDDTVKQDINDPDSAPASANDPDSSQQDQSMLDEYDDYECPSDTVGLDEDEFTKHSQWIVRDLETGHPFLDNTSDVSACCSEEKNMEDFEDDCEPFLPDDSNHGADNPSANSSSSDIGLLRQPIPRRKNKFAAAHQLRKTLKQTLNNIHQIRGDSTSSTRDSEAKLNNNPSDAGARLSQDPGDEQVQQKSAATIAEFEQIKAASLNLTTITTQICSDDDLKKLSEYNLANLNEPGKTLLWDLLQDGKIEHLGANLYADVETTLVNLVMSFGGKFIRYKFIEACLENLALGKSVIISLRLLPRFMSFGTVARSLEIETYSIVLWAEEEHNMSKNFFKNLVDYYDYWFKSCEQELQQLERRPLSPIAEDGCRSIAATTTTTTTTKRTSMSISQYSSPVFPHIDGIIMRMTFLSFIYSKSFSPASMKLGKDQMDQLWDCLTSDPNPKASDVLFQWIYQQAISEDLHGIDDELMDYILKCKMPSLRPLRYSLRGLKLLEQLLWIRQENECCHELSHPAAQLLWEIGFDSLDEDVGMAAIRMINHFYVYTNHAKTVKCKQSTDFMRNCMKHLFSALHDLDLPYKESIEETSITMERMQKVILLIRTHLEVFKARWSYYLRTLQLNNEADLISHRLNAHDIKLTMTLRLVIQSASTSDKVILELQPNDFIGEMRAEVVKWWFTLGNRDINFANDSDLSPSTDASTNSPPDHQVSDKAETGEQEQSPVKEAANRRISGFTKFLLESHDKLKLLSQNQEILADWDERQIHEFDFKDFQVIYVLREAKANELGGRGSDKSEESSVRSSSSASYPTIDTIPAIAFLHTPKFERLIEVAQFLGTFKRKESIELTNKAKTLSRRVWEIIQILPTSPNYKETLKLRGIDDKYLAGVKLPITQNLLSPDCPQRLLYSLQILDILKSPRERPNWGPTFIRKGGLADLLDVFLSGKLLPSDADEEWDEWLQECLAYVLKLLYQLGTRACVTREQPESSHHHPRNLDLATMLNKKFGLDGGSSSRRGSGGSGSSKRLRRNKSKLHGGGVTATTDERVMIPQLSEDLLKLLADKGEQVSSTMIRILDFVTKRRNEQIYLTAMPSRAMIVHHVMAFLSSWCKSDPKFPETLDLISDCSKYEHLLKALLLDDNDPSTRREASHGFFKLHYSCVARSLESASELNASSSSSESSTVRGHHSPPDTNQSDASSTSGAANSADLSRLASQFSADLLVTLIKFLPIAEAMRPPKPFHRWIPYGEYIHEINLPGCKDYFWLVCRLIEAPYYAYNPCPPPTRGRRRTHSKGSDESDDHREQQVDMSANGAGDSGQDRAMDSSGVFDCSKSLHCDALSIDLNDLCKYLADAIRRRLVYETRDYSVEDDTLRGMLMMMVMAIRRDTAFRYTKDGQFFIVELYNYLFSPPTEQHRYLPKCKSATTRSTAFDLMIALVEQCPQNYMALVDYLKCDQHQAVVKCSHPTDYWPHDDCRSETGFVGLVNLGATCYLATCMQHLFMIPDLRYAILSIQDPKAIRHGEIMKELQKIFAFLLESERKAFNPRNFCKVYTMDNHPLNIAEQTDMTEFLTDLITKIEESSPVLRQIIKNLFSGTLSNNVVSLDCPHISRTTEEFYTLRVQVADMRNLNDSLDELTIKDTLEGDNMYTCSTCEKKVRAEKRACIVKLPRILCFNTMRYTFNMTTMTKEKVNTHFSFPLKLDMADYLESNLMKRSQQSVSSPTESSNSCSSRNSSASGHESSNSSSTSAAAAAATLAADAVGPKGEQRPIPLEPTQDDQYMQEAAKSAVRSNESSNDGGDATPPVRDENQAIEDSETLYELIGVTVHTGNADGGHYYCFIRDCEDSSMDKPKWYLFNDAEVKTFDDALIGTECYGGELTTKSYDAINDRFMDFSIEKTNSAYMLFYKRVDYKYRSKSVALRYLESDTQRNQYVLPADCPTKLLDELILSHVKRMSQETSQAAAAAAEDNPQPTATVRANPHNDDSSNSNYAEELETAASRYSSIFSEVLDFRKLCQQTYDDFVLPRHLANWIWHENLKFSRDQYIFEHNYFDFMWQICANVPRTLTQPFTAQACPNSYTVSDDRIAKGTMHLAIVFVLGVLINSREKPNLNNWTDLIRKQFNSSQAASDWAMQLIDDEDSWLKQMLLKCPVDTVRQLFQRVYSDLTGGSTKQHKKIRLVK